MGWTEYGRDSPIPLWILCSMEEIDITEIIMFMFKELSNGATNQTWGSEKAFSKN